MSTPRITLLLLLVVVPLLLAETARCDYIVNPLDPARSWYEPFDFLTFHIDNEDYLAFMANMKRVLVAESQNHVDDLPMLRKQSENPKTMPPAKWLILEVRSQYTKIMLALRQDNLYITGFTNEQGYWYMFGNLPRELMGAYVLPINDDYTSLVNGFENLATIRMSWSTLYDALNAMAALRLPGPRDLGCLSRYLAIMAVTFAEASRFKDIQAIVNEGLRNRLEGVYIGIYASKLVVHWKDLSCAILIAHQNGGRWGSREANKVADDLEIRNINVALDTLNVMLWPKRCSKPIYGLVG